MWHRTTYVQVDLILSVLMSGVMQLFVCHTSNARRIDDRRMRVWGADYAGGENDRSWTTIDWTGEMNQEELLAARIRHLEQRPADME